MGLSDDAIFKDGVVVKKIEGLKNHSDFCPERILVNSSFEYVLAVVENATACRILKHVDAS